MPLSQQKHLRKKWFNKSEAGKAIILKNNREEWLSVRKKHPRALRTDFQHEIAPRLYQWLKKYDGDWLSERCPPPYRRVGSARQVDWKKRDIELSQKVRASAKRLKVIKGRPLRISKQAIGRELDELTSITNKGSWIKLPLTMSALAEVVETPLEFAVRRVQWAADCFRDEGIVPAPSTLGLRAVIKHHLWSHPEVKAAFQTALQSLEAGRTVN
jgi:hypothetical protein